MRIILSGKIDKVQDQIKDMNNQLKEILKIDRPKVIDLMNILKFSKSQF